MSTELAPLNPLTVFDDNLRPAQLMLQVYRLLDANDTILSSGEMVETMRGVIRASTNEELMLVYNELFLGLVRERAQMPRSALRHATICHLLRQSVVASCTALETYLPALLRAQLPTVIAVRGREFMPRGNNDVSNYVGRLTFGVDDVLRMLEDENAPTFIADKILGLTNFTYLSDHKGITVAGALLGIDNPWKRIADHLQRNQEELTRTFSDTFKRRNNIVHRADRPQTDPGGPPQSIDFAWTQHAVDTIKHVATTLDHLVALRVAELKALSDD